MNISNLKHVVVAVIVQLVVFLATSDIIYGAIAGSALFIGRELTQAEYRWAAMFNDGRRGNMPLWALFDPRIWRDLDSWLDWLLPIAATTIVTIVVGLL